MRYRLYFVLTITAIMLCACQPAEPFCPAGSITYREPGSPFSVPESLSSPVNSEPLPVMIRGEEMAFDQVISGPLCNQALRGKVYVACDVEVYAWEGRSNFLDDCDFRVEPGTVIYVAAHNNTAYYKGCASCHTSD
jgi:hypothetical protein